MDSVDISPVSNWPGHLLSPHHFIFGFEVILRVYVVYTAVLDSLLSALMQHRPPISSTGLNSMQPTAADEALIGETLRLSNARESWLGHSFLPVAPKGWPTTSSSSSLGKNTRGIEPMPPRQQESQTLLASRHVAQPKVARIASLESMYE